LRVEDLGPNAVALHNDFEAIQEALQSSYNRAALEKEIAETSNVSDDFEQADKNMNVVNHKKTQKDEYARISLDTIKQIRNTVFHPRVSEADRLLMFNHLQMVPVSRENMLAALEEKYKEAYVGTVLNIMIGLKPLIGYSDRIKRQNEINRLKSVEGQKAKKERDAAEATKSSETPKDESVKPDSRIVSAPDHIGMHDEHQNMIKKSQQAERNLLRSYSLAWARDIQPDPSNPSVYTVKDMETGFVHTIPKGLEITVFTRAMLKIDKKFNGVHKSVSLNLPAFSKKLEERDIPMNFFLKPLVIRFNESKDIVEINAGCNAPSTIIEKIRERMIEADAKNGTSKYEDDILEINDSFEKGKGLFVADFCATRASSRTLRRERKAEQRAIQATKFVQTYVITTTVEVDSLDEHGNLVFNDEGEIEKEKDILTHTVTVQTDLSGSRNYYKVLNSNKGKVSNGRVSFGAGGR
jgi:hypothetical protein